MNSTQQTTVVIVAGGLATRMHPLTETVPKCMVDVRGKPLIEHQLDIFRNQGFKRIHFCVAHLAEKVDEYFGDGKRFGMDITYSQEKTLLGTAGAVKLIESDLRETFIVYYGDIITEFQLEPFLAFHRKMGGIGTIAVHKRRPDSTGRNAILIKDEKITGFYEKADRTLFLGNPLLSDYNSSAIYALEPRIFSFIPNDVVCDFGRDVFPKVIAAEESLFAFPHISQYNEIGTMEKLKKVNG
jgi:NDP-sugar pyrophosphorylase family protein